MSGILPRQLLQLCGKEFPGPSLRGADAVGEIERWDTQVAAARHQIVVIHTEFNNEMRGAFPKSTDTPTTYFDSRHVTRADLPFTTIGVFHVHPNITHGAAREDFQSGSCPSSPSTMRISPPIPTASFYPRPHQLHHPEISENMERGPCKDKTQCM